MKKMISVSLFLGMLVSSNVFAQIPVSAPKSGTVTSETKELVRILLEANGMRASMIRIFEDIINQAPKESQADLRKVLKGDAIIDEIIPVYAKHFSNAELRELINFYKSPVGAKNLALTPVLMTEVMQVSQKYFEKGVQSIEKPSKASNIPAKK